MSILFINGSPNKEGNTTALAQKLLAGKKYETLHLVDYKLYSYGQNFADDQFAEILAAMQAADTIVIGSPVYWHNMSGAVRNLLDRFYGPVQQGELSGKKLAFIFQGAAPEKWMLEKAEYTINRFAALYGLTYIGMAANSQEAAALSKSLFDEYDFSGKTIIPFSTHGGSSFAGTPATIQQLEPNAVMLDGLTISRNDIQEAEQEIVDWVNGLGL